MRIVSIMGGNLGRILQRAATETAIDLTFFQNRVIADNPNKISEVIGAMKKADIVLLYLHSEPFWEEIKPLIKKVGKNRSIDYCRR